MSHALQIINSPWAIVPASLSQIVQIYRDRITGNQASAEEIAAKITEARNARGSGPEEREYQVLDGVAVVPLIGVMGRRMNLFSMISGGVSTQIVGNRLIQAAQDPEVRAIVLEVDSPGGTVDGTQDLARVIADVRAVKPVITAATGMMCSAGYWVGSGTDQVFATEASAEIGSIGVVCEHIDYSKADEQRGIVRTEVFAGKYKRITSSTAPLSTEGRDYLQSMLDALYGQFVAAVAGQRGTDPDIVHERMADGRVFLAAEALDRNMLDGIEPMGEVMSRARASTVTSVNLGRLANSGKQSMNLTKESLEKDHADVAKAVRDEGFAAGVESAKQSAAAEQAQAVKTAREEAIVAERERMSGIDALALPGMDELVAAMKADGTSVAEAAQKVVAKQKAMLADVKAGLEADAPPMVKQAPPSGGNASATTPAEKAAKAKAYAAEHSVSFTQAYQKLFEGDR